ncbi:MAG: Flp family type IVb pilin [Deltaproteobacteria bacterium]|nr:MAG: Flp family type IVb pilin [Deltaproteobacteria bacterium]
MNNPQSATQLLRDFVADEEGATAIEYGLIAALMSIVAIAGFRALADSLDNVYTEWTSAVETAIGDS